MNAEAAMECTPVAEILANDVAEPHVGRLTGLRGRDLTGYVHATHGDGQIKVLNGGQFLGVAQFVAADANPSGTGNERYFSFRIPKSLYDGRLHFLEAILDGRHDVRLNCGSLYFLGDPLIVSPSETRRISQRGSQPRASDSHHAAIQADAVASIMQTLQVQTQALAKVLEHMPGISVQPKPAQSIVPAPVVADRLPQSLAEQYGSLFPEAVRLRGSAPDVIWLGVIDWQFRIQRPQHLAAKLADLGSRVFYVSIVFERADERGRFRILQSPHPGVFELRLRLDGTLPENIYGGFLPEQIRELHAALDDCLLLLGIHSPTIVIQYPSWLPVAAGIPGASLVHDCLDLVSGFSNVPAEMVRLEEKLVEVSDLVVTSSEPLAARIGAFRESVLVRNGADVEFFASASPEPDLQNRETSAGTLRSPVIGYFGAISEWYQIEWIEACARRRPNWQFDLIGSTYGCDISDAKSLPNVKFWDEQPYASLPAHLAGWDVAVIPFKLPELIQCTNPVKLYEYMAGGKPVVASPMPEVVRATDLVYIAENAEGFEEQIERALNEDCPELVLARRNWARQNDWWSRGVQFREAIDRLLPKVSIVILCYNNWVFSKACIDSVLAYSDYDNLELIVVDNASTDETRAHLRRLCIRDPRIRVVLNETNLGFAAGNNVGIREASGEYVILLNNDTFTTRGWVRDLIRPLQQDPVVGMTGPLTNNIGNEQKVIVAYRDMSEMRIEALKIVRRYPRRRFETSGLAFFCIAIRRDVLERVGLLDEVFGLGFFEDDDYCRRVEAAGYKLIIADDVFVHHHLSASFDSLGAARKREQMERNKEIYESKWGSWKPHWYRQEAGFG